MPPVSSRIAATTSHVRGVQRMIGPELARHLARFVAHVDGDEQPGAAEPGDLQAFQPHAALAEDHDRVADLQFGGFDRRHAVAQRLQAGRLAVGNAVVDLHQRDLGQDGRFRQSSRAGRSR